MLHNYVGGVFIYGSTLYNDDVGNRELGKTTYLVQRQKATYRSDINEGKEKATNIFDVWHAEKGYSTFGGKSDMPKPKP